MSKKSKKLALALAFEVSGEGNVSSQWRLWVCDIIRGRKQYGAYNDLVQELRLDDALFAAYFRLDRVFVLILYNSLCSETSTICLPAVFSIFSCCYGKTRCLLVLVSCQKGAWHRVLFFRKVELFSTWKDALSCRKRHRWCFKKRSGLFWKHLHLHLHLVILQMLLSKATYNWGIHKAIHLEEAIRQRKCS